MQKATRFGVLLAGVGVLVAVFVVSHFPESFAGPEHNVSGWAWSENIGWISFNSTNTGGGNYGVSMDAQNGKFSGYAWSEHIGWIDFKPEGPYPGPPAKSAQLNKGPNKVEGWARALGGIGGGWDGWIKMSDASYGVKLSGCAFDGWAWGSTVVGWIHFAGPGYGVKTTACAGAPSAISLSASPGDYCAAPLQPIVSWTFSDPDGDPQAAYQVQVDTSQGFGSPVADSGKVNSSSQSYTIPSGKLSYGKTYYWRLKVWDPGGLESSWASGPSFQTPSHAYPAVAFSWSPTEPATQQTVSFTDSSQTFGGSSVASRSWTFQDALPANSSAQNPQTAFQLAGAKNVSETVQDSDGLSCTKNATVNVGGFSPLFKEVIPR